jgi:ribosome-binding protein aMBF1 (putative translation factor)
MPAPYENDPDRRQFARLLKWFHEARGLSREELGAIIGFSASTIKSVELLHRSGTLYMAKRLDPPRGAPSRPQVKA